MADETGLQTVPEDQVSRGNLIPSAVGMSQDEMAQFFDAQDDNTRMGEARIHRLAICQPGSPEIQKEIKGYMPGMILDNKTRQVLSTYGPPPWLAKSGVPESEITKVHYLECALNMKLPSEYVKWKTKQEQKASTEGGRWHFRTLDPTEPRAREGLWPPLGTFGKPGSGDEKKPPPVTENTNFMLLPIGPDGNPISNFLIVSFNRTSADTGKLVVDHVAGLRTIKQVNWERTIYLWMTKHTDGDNTWYQYNLAPQGRLLREISPDAYRMSREMGLQLADKTHGKAFQLAALQAAVEDDDAGRGPTSEGGSDIEQPDNPFANDGEEPPPPSGEEEGTF